MFDIGDRTGISGPKILFQRLITEDEVFADVEGEDTVAIPWKVLEEVYAGYVRWFHRQKVMREYVHRTRAKRDAQRFELFKKTYGLEGEEARLLYEDSNSFATRGFAERRIPLPRFDDPMFDVGAGKN